jgi:hypothetical protein
VEKKIKICAAAAVLIGLALVVAVIADPALRSPSVPSGVIGTPVGSAQLSQLKAIALNSTLANKVGVGSTFNGGHPNYPIAINGSSPLIVNGEAGVVYVSADYCPYCAITRWGLVIALMRFGNFTGLKYMTSSPNDIDASTPTFTFSDSSYYSNNVYFDAVETADINGKPLGTPDAIEKATFERYDLNNSNLPAEDRGSIPFIDFGNSSFLLGAPVSPQLVQGKNWDQIIALLNNTGSPISQGVIGSADMITAYICRINFNISQTSACQQAYVKSIDNVVSIGKG